jgi:hypothetical protein
MVRNGDAHKPIWISEMNSNAVPIGSQADDIIGWGAYGQVSLGTQAEWATLAYERALTEWPYVGVVNFWFFKPASDADADQAYYYFRMLEPNFTPLPVYDGVKAYANQKPRMYAGTHQEDHWAIKWDGEWFDRVDERAMLGGYRVAGRDASARVCVAEGDFRIIHGPPQEEQGTVTIEEADDGCLTLSADVGSTIDGFVVGDESEPVWALILLASAGIGLAGWGYWRQRAQNRHLTA